MSLKLLNNPKGSSFLMAIAFAAIVAIAIMQVVYILDSIGSTGAREKVTLSASQVGLKLNKLLEYGNLCANVLTPAPGHYTGAATVAFTGLTIPGAGQASLSTAVGDPANFVFGNLTIKDIVWARSPGPANTVRAGNPVAMYTSYAGILTIRFTNAAGPTRAFAGGTLSSLSYPVTFLANAVNNNVDQCFVTFSAQDACASGGGVVNGGSTNCAGTYYSVVSAGVPDCTRVCAPNPFFWVDRFDGQGIPHCACLP